MINVLTDSFVQHLMYITSELRIEIRIDINRIKAITTIYEHIYCINRRK